MAAKKKTARKKKKAGRRRFLGFTPKRKPKYLPEDERFFGRGDVYEAGTEGEDEEEVWWDG